MENILFREDNDLPQIYISKENGQKDFLSYEGKKIYLNILIKTKILRMVRRKENWILRNKI